MPIQAIVSAPADEPQRGFTSHHPLAEVVARLHRAHGGLPFTGIGRVGCAPCWEAAIRNDERIVVEYELPRELDPDPLFVDEIAVAKACRGNRPALTPAERAEAVRRLLDKGLTRDQIARRLGVATRDVRVLGASRSKASGRSLRLVACNGRAVNR